ncbi:MAG: ribonuclease R [Cocleimonas sp.]
MSSNERRIRRMKNYKDPHKEREEKKYDNPIPSRELMLDVMNKAGHPIGYNELTETLGITEQDQLDAIKYRLRAMERDGQILFNRGKKYLPVEKADLVAGKVQGHPDGFGFLVPDDGSDDLYLHGKQMRKILHGDRVLASVTGIDRKGRREGAIVEILEHNTENVVGRYFVESGLGFVTPDNSRIAQDILIPPESNNGAKSGQIVVAKIVEFPTSRHQPIGKIAEVLGDHMAPGMEIEIALRSHDLPHIWPQDVVAASDKLSDEVLEEDKKGRTDLRKMPLVTIDGEDSRDFDDAVYCEKDNKGNWVLTVAIADVSHYVQINSALDKEALNRATSVYFPAEVIPMLPEKISNGLCSLNPHLDRLCMVCEATIDSDGEVISYNFKSGLMNSHARLTYTKMAAIVVDHDAELREEYKEIVDHLDDLYKLYAVLRKARDERGSIDFETTETQIVFGKDRKIENIKPTTRNDAHKIIEECMVTANMCAARFLKQHKIPALHRVHRGPEVEKLFKVNEFLNGLGLKLGGGAEPQPSDYAALLASVKERPDARLIQTVMLRSMSRAQYEPVDKEKPESTRHFGLARKDYAHFTSPIRRYPDLLVHRAILHILKNGSAEGSAQSYAYDYTQMKALGAHSSECEKRADDASRDVMAWLKAEYMQDKVGETFTGIISTVTNFGLFVELDDVYVEGLVHVSALKSDYYHFDQGKHQMVGENSGKSYRLGDTIEVLVARVDLDDRKIDFTLPGSESDPSSRPKKKSKSDFKNKKSSKDVGFKSPKKKDKVKKDAKKKKKKTVPKNMKRAKKKAQQESKQ